MVVCDQAATSTRSPRRYHHVVPLLPEPLSFGPSPALGDLDGDGKLEVVIPSKNRNLYAVHWNGTDLPGWPVVYASQLYTESSPVIADIDGDGALDVVLGDETKYHQRVECDRPTPDGFPLALGDAVRATPRVADVDEDGDVDMIAAGWDKTVYVWDFPGDVQSAEDAVAALPRQSASTTATSTTVVPTPVGGVRSGRARAGGNWSGSFRTTQPAPLQGEPRGGDGQVPGTFRRWRVPWA